MIHSNNRKYLLMFLRVLLSWGHFLMITLGAIVVFSPENMVMIRKWKLILKLIPFTLTHPAVITSLVKEGELHSHCSVILVMSPLFVLLGLFSPFHYDLGNRKFVP